MELTQKQKEGLKIALERFHAGEAYTCIAGYAGVGKSTLIQFIIDALDIDPDKDVCYCAYTGKAANVLKNKNCPNAITAHKLLYKAELFGDHFIFSPKSLDGNYKIIVVDEVSMLPKEMWDLLLTHGVHVLACGDPFQLPTINPDEDNHILDNPHIFLDEIMRQAADNEIIQLSFNIRQGKPINKYKGKDIQVIDKTDLVTGMYTWADQILCATNKTRANINQEMRKILGKSGDPQEGDKLICLHNNWEIASSEGTPLTNGTILTIDHCENGMIWVPRFISHKPVYTIKGHFTTDSGEAFAGLTLDKQTLTTGTPALTQIQKAKLSRLGSKYYTGPDILDMDYAYAITGHKAQGSEFEKVLVIEESFPNIPIEHARWLYTCVTRASKQLILVRK